MTATLPPAVDPFAGNSPAQQGHTLTWVLGVLTDDCTAKQLRPVGLSVLVRDGIEPPSVTIQFPAGDTTSVDALADAYLLPPAGLDDVLYERSGRVTVDDRTLHVLAYTLRPATPAVTE